MGLIITPCETARKYRNFTRPSEIILYSDSPYIDQLTDFDKDDAAQDRMSAVEQTFARTRSGHFIGVDFTGESFGNKEAWSKTSIRWGGSKLLSIKDEWSVVRS